MTPEQLSEVKKMMTGNPCRVIRPITEADKLQHR